MKSALDYKVDCVNANPSENTPIRLTPEILLENAELRNNLDVETKTRKKLGEAVKQKTNEIDKLRIRTQELKFARQSDN